eukprot:snap_masked-scaffold_33-processed-gene-3.17-mRNA-1 protein AED:1.00 eAED:1.00 QI:0/-1/0/0/-1/1/1/0/330
MRKSTKFSSLRAKFDVSKETNTAATLKLSPRKFSKNIPAETLRHLEGKVGSVKKSFLGSNKEKWKKTYSEKKKRVTEPCASHEELDTKTDEARSLEREKKQHEVCGEENNLQKSILGGLEPKNKKKTKSLLGEKKEKTFNQSRKIENSREKEDQPFQLQEEFTDTSKYNMVNICPEKCPSLSRAGVVIFSKSEHLQLLTATETFNHAYSGYRNVLEFEKGDLFIQTRIIDAYWCEGILINRVWYGVFREGRFPTSYTRVSPRRFEHRIARYSYLAGDEQEAENAEADLHFYVGDRILVIDKVNNDWGRGLLVNGSSFQLGLFPFIFTAPA